MSNSGLFSLYMACWGFVNRPKTLYRGICCGPLVGVKVHQPVPEATQRVVAYANEAKDQLE